jgi:hypothetical protein
MYLIGRVKPRDINIPKIKQAFTNQKFLEDITEVDGTCDTAQKLLGLRIYLETHQIEDIMQTASLITDDYPFTEFPLWRYLKKKYFQPQDNQK